MRNALLIAGEVGALPDGPDQVAPVEAVNGEKEVATIGAPTEQAMAKLEQCAKTLRELQRAHREVTFSSVAGGVVSANEAIARVDTVRRLEALARHAWRSAAQLVGSRA
jgi:phosphate:Na+ symporter